MLRSLILLLASCFSLANNLDEAWSELINNRPQSARALFEQAMVLDKDPSLAKIGWFLTYTGNGPTDELAEAALKILRDDPLDPAVELVMAWMKPMRSFHPTWATDARPLIEDSQPENPELRIHFSNHLRHIASLEGDRQLFEKALAMSSYLNQWRFSRRFGSYPIPDFDQVWPPEKTSYWAEQPLSSFRSGVVVPAGQATGTGIVYAYSDFSLKAAAPVLFRIFSYQTIKVFVDGRLLVSIPHLEREEGRIQSFRANLPAGHHEVLVKITQTRGKNGQFSLSLLADGLQISEPKYPALDLNQKRWKAKPVSYGLKQKVTGDPRPLARFVAGYIAAGERDLQLALTTFENLVQSNPSSQLLGGILAEIKMTGVRFQPEEKSMGHAYQILSQLCADENRTADNLTRLGRLLYNARYSEEAIPFIEAALELNPAHCEAIETQLDLAIKENLFDLRAKAIKNLEGLGDDHRWALRLRFANAKAEDNLDEIRFLLEKLADLEPWDGYRAELLGMNDDFLGAIANLEYRWEIFPENNDYPYEIANNYAKLGDRVSQRDWLTRTLERDPSHRRALLDIINLDSYEGQSETAKARILDYLLIEPADSAFRQMLSHMEGRTAFESFRVNTHDVIEAARHLPPAKDADSELLLDQLMIRLFPDGSQMRYTHLVTRVLTKDGVDNESELNLPQDLEILELRTIKQDGTVFYPENIDNKTTISLSGIGVGDFIDEEHIEYLPPAYYDPNGVDASMSFVFQGIDRVYHHSELVLIYPSGLEPAPNIQSKNYPGEPETREEEDLTYVRWLTKEMPPVAPEPSMPNPGYFLPRATLSFNTEWSEIRDFFTNAVRLRMIMTKPLDELLKTWQAEHPKKFDLAEHMYRTVVDAIEPSNQFYQNINLVWENKSGNASLLLAKLYEEAGIPCQIVLARPAELLLVSFDLPLPDLFTYALLKIEVNGKTIWLDPNQKDLPFGYIPFDFRASNGLVLDPQQDPPLLDIPMTDIRSERIEFEYEFLFDEDGQVAALGTERFFGSLAGQLKERFSTLNQPEIRQRVEVGINANFPGSNVTIVEIKDADVIGVFAIESAFENSGLVQKGDTWRIDQLLPGNSIQGKYASQPTRHLPLHIRNPHINAGKVTLHLPEGMRWLSEEQTIRRESPFGKFELSITHIDDLTIEVKRSYNIHAQIIEVPDYQSFLEFCQFMTENEEVRLQAK